jgi:hypothetical protein
MVMCGCLVSQSLQRQPSRLFTQRRKLCTNDARNIAGYLHLLRRILIYQSMGCVRPLGKSHEQRDRTGHYERDDYDYEYVERDATTGELDRILQCDADELCARSGGKRH